MTGFDQQISNLTKEVGEMKRMLRIVVRRLEMQQGAGGMGGTRPMRIEYC